MSDYLDPNNEELLRDFFEEAELQVDLMEQNILVLENDPTDQDSVDELFRAAHTLKGGAATVRMDELAEFTHLVEDVLDGVRSGTFRLNPSAVDIILTAVDVIKMMLEARNEGRAFNDPKTVNTAKERLHSLLVKPEAPASAAQPMPPAAGAPASVSAGAAAADSQLPSAVDLQSVADDFMSEYELYELFENAGKGNPVYRVKVLFDESALMNTVGGIQVFSVLKNIGVILKTTPDFEQLNEDVFYPSVYYYITTEEPVEVIRKKVTITDVTLGNEILQITEKMVEDLCQASLLEAQSSPSAAKEAAADPVTPSAGEPEAASPSSAETPAARSETPAAAASSGEAAPSLPADAGDHHKKALSKKDNASILRVDSRKIDNLLNMVSESVINKSIINKVTVDLTSLYSNYQSMLLALENKVRSMVDSIPDIIHRSEAGVSVRELLDQYRSEESNLFADSSVFESTLKKTMLNLRNVAQKMSVNTANMQEGIMKIRMVPISNIFSRFPRVVRDLSHSLKKKVELILEGEDTELDKSVIEDLLDPLIHCVRNSVDHGIEIPELRRKQGKPETGEVTLRASNEGSMILIEVIDDGAGMDPKVLFKKAVEKGLIPADAKLSESEIFDLIYAPGFSTSDHISNVSGRGVGMDVVRTQIEKLKGSIFISSELGKGTKISIRLPLTLAIIRGLLVRVGTEIYSIPVSGIIDSHRIEQSDIKIVNGYEVFNVRDEVIFLTRLTDCFNIPDTATQSHRYVVIVGAADRKMGLVVDQLIGEEDVVIKPLKDDFSSAAGIAGATILGDGKVSLIVDVTQLLDLGSSSFTEGKKELLKIGQK